MIDNLQMPRAYFILISANFSNNVEIYILYVYNRLSYNAVSYALYEST